jgi:putative hydrolase of the HAD superfamily
MSAKHAPGAAIAAVTFDLGDTLTDLREGSGDYEARSLLRARRVYDLLVGAGARPGEREEFCAALVRGVEDSYAEALARRQGLRIETALRGFFGQAGLDVGDGLLDASADAYCAPGPDGLRLRLGARDTLARLRAAGLRLWVISNTIQPAVHLDGSLARAGLLDFFSVRTYSSEAGVAKPHPDIFHAALAGLGVPPEHAVHVGDRLLADVAGAQGVGMRAVLIEVGQRPEWDPAIVPDGRIKELPELPAALAALR